MLRVVPSAMAADQVEVMRALGFERFAVVGHDRGGRVAHRMVLDHPDAVERIAVLDIAPTATMYAVGPGDGAGLTARLGAARTTKPGFPGCGIWH